MTALINNRNREKSEPLLRENRPELRLLGTALGGIYCSATCHRACRGGDHVIEALGSRVYNLAVGSYSLLCVGLYDECLNLVRSIGEVSNILSLSISDHAEFDAWLRSSKPDRLRRFSPAKIRQLIEKSGSGMLFMDGDWYSDLCEKCTHVTPQTAPNKYELGRPVCGGIVQKEGLDKALEQLTTIVTPVALYLCKYSGLDDIFERISSCLDELKDPAVSHAMLGSHSDPATGGE
jgi:hypothetical protein